MCQTLESIFRKLAETVELSVTMWSTGYPSMVYFPALDSMMTEKRQTKVRAADNKMLEACRSRGTSVPREAR